MIANAGVLPALGASRISLTRGKNTERIAGQGRRSAARHAYTADRRGVLVVMPVPARAGEENRRGTKMEDSNFRESCRTNCSRGTK